MNITIFGASGNVGRIVTVEALKHGHKVVAFTHASDPFDADPNLKVIAGDVHDEAMVASAVQGADVIISALGSWGTPNKDVLATAMRCIIPVMQSQGITRIISLTGADARAPGDAHTLLHRITHSLLEFAAGKVLYDGEEHIRLLAGSGLDWTVIRSPIMHEHGSKTGYALSRLRPMPWNTINRHMVALAMLDQAETPTAVGQAPFIAQK